MSPASIHRLRPTRVTAVRGLSGRVRFPGARAAGPHLALAVGESRRQRTVGLWSRVDIFDAMSFAGTRRLDRSIAGTAQASVRALLARDSRMGAHQARRVATSKAGHQALRASRAISAGVVRACLEVPVAVANPRRRCRSGGSRTVCSGSRGRKESTNEQVGSAHRRVSRSHLWRSVAARSCGRSA